ncbi:Zn-ribbon domain-containing OB-fold protein [Streptomyces sp. NPDC058695]|uniref:Zn-ribbon domain-containing OB-fold protein n=1 Tax=Streptomyces sp. NPDC058695 TaxID=3346604 RepID=UPI003652D383
MNPPAPHGVAEAQEHRSPALTHRAGLSRGELRYQRCAHCASAVFPPRTLCPDCGTQQLGWERSTGDGTVYATTVVRGRDGAHNVVLVDLDDGFRMMSRVEGPAPQDVAIGDRVRFRTTADGDTAVFEPKEDAR